MKSIASFLELNEYASIKLSTKISEELTKLQFTGAQKVNSMLRKKD